MSASPGMWSTQTGWHLCGVKTDWAGKRWLLPYPGPAFPALHAVLHANMLNTETLDPSYNKKLKLQAFSGRTVFLGMVVPGARYLGLCAVCNILSFLVSPDKGCKRVYKPGNLAQLDSFHLMITAQERRERKQKWNFLHPAQTKLQIRGTLQSLLKFSFPQL